VASKKKKKAKDLHCELKIDSGERNAQLCVYQSNFSSFLPAKKKKAKLKRKAKKPSQQAVKRGKETDKNLNKRTSLTDEGTAEIFPVPKQGQWLTRPGGQLRKLMFGGHENEENEESPHPPKIRCGSIKSRPIRGVRGAGQSNQGLVEGLEEKKFFPSFRFSFATTR
jgi:hypothetical protein